MRATLALPTTSGAAVAKHPVRGQPASVVARLVIHRGNVDQDVGEHRITCELHTRPGDGGTRKLWALESGGSIDATDRIHAFGDGLQFSERLKQHKRASRDSWFLWPTY